MGLVGGKATFLKLAIKDHYRQNAETDFPQSRVFDIEKLLSSSVNLFNATASNIDLDGPLNSPDGKHCLGPYLYSVFVISLG